MAVGSSMKDRLILSVAAVVALYAVGGWLWYSALLDRASAWNASRKKFTAAVAKVQKERKLIAERTKWIDRYDEEREKMPLFPEGEDVKTHWLRRMDALAEQNHVWIFSRDPGQEQQVGGAIGGGGGAEHVGLHGRRRQLRLLQKVGNGEHEKWREKRRDETSISVPSPSVPPRRRGRRAAGRRQ